jgi:hypothetical protein
MNLKKIIATSIALGIGYMSANTALAKNQNYNDYIINNNLEIKNHSLIMKRDFDNDGKMDKGIIKKTKEGYFANWKLSSGNDIKINYNKNLGLSSIELPNYGATFDYHNDKIEFTMDNGSKLNVNMHLDSKIKKLKNRSIKNQPKAFQWIENLEKNSKQIDLYRLQMEKATADIITEGNYKTFERLFDNFENQGIDFSKSVKKIAKYL